MPSGKSVVQLVLNAGSSSIKYALFRATPAAGSVSWSCLVQGLAEGIGTKDQFRIKHENEAGKKTHNLELPNHRVALKRVMDLVPPELKSEIGSVGHRLVHGAEDFTGAVVVNEEVIKSMTKATVLAPLHNPWCLLGVDVAKDLLGCPQVGVFDTSFHQTMEPHVYLYALPYELYEKHGIRRYGFHGTSYRYVLGQTAKMLGKSVDQVNMIACHIGNGASMCAIKGGKCVDTTMGLTPLEGLVMGTRCGDIDPAIIPHLCKTLGYTVEEVGDMLNKKSGLLGLCGTSDDREIEQRAMDKEPIGLLAKKIQVHRIRKYLGAYMVALNGEVDAVVFTGGMAEKSHFLRTLVCEDLQKLGLIVDESRNQADGGKFSTETPVHSQGSPIQIWVIPTNEELCIAQQSYELVHA